MKFAYKAKKGPTEVVQGELEAENEDAALGKVASLGLVPIRITEISAATGQVVSRVEKKSPVKPKIQEAAPPISLGDRAKVRVSHKELNIFTRQFSILTKASVPLLKIFDVLSLQTQSSKFKAALMDMQKTLRDGGGLSDTLAHYPRIFSQIYVNLINSGEISGTLDQVLGQLAEFADKDEETRSKVQSAMIYPLFLFLVGVLTVFILMTFVMPRLMNLFGDLGTELPGITKFMMAISVFCQNYWVVMVAVAAGIFSWFRIKGLSPAQKRLIDSFLIHAPVIKNVTEKSEIARFLRSLELLYGNGIPLYKAVSIATRTISNDFIRESLENVPDQLEGGATLAQSLEKVNYVTPFVCQMVSVGEESGALNSALKETANFYEQETNHFVKIATSLLEPLMILGIGGVIGFIVISMLLPIFEIHVTAR